MKSFRAQIFAGLVLSIASTSVFAQTQSAPQLSAGNIVPVTVDNFIHALQDAIGVSQKGAAKFELPNWDAASQKKVRDALLVLGSTMPDFKKSFGTKDQVDPVRHLVATAAAWGGNPDKDATYLNITPANNDGNTV